MKKVFVLPCLVLLMSGMQARHLHPRSWVKVGEIYVENDSRSEKQVAGTTDDEEVDGTRIDVIRNIRPNRFVPINSVFSFKTYPPCEDGLMRDVLGICREVWD